MQSLFVALFLIYNSMLLSVLRRRNEIGILRCLGATPAQLREFREDGWNLWWDDEPDPMDHPDSIAALLTRTTTIA